MSGTRVAGRIVSRTLLVCGLAALGYAASVVIATRGDQARDRQRLEVLAGHRDTFFRPLRRVQAGDAITLRTAGGDFAYVVDSTAVVPPGDVSVLEPTVGRTLTLVTCYPFSWAGPAPERFIVRARAVDLSASRLP